MVNEIRRGLKNNKILFPIVKGLYNVMINIRDYPKRIKKSQRQIHILNKISGPEKKKIWFMCICCNSNLGDQAQTFCIKTWLKKYYEDYELVPVWTTAIVRGKYHLMDELKRRIQKGDLIIFQSGYASTDLSEGEFAHRIIVENFPKNRIIFFPQTIFYTCEKQKKISADIYNRHGNIVFLVRDKVSYDIVKNEFYNIEVYLYPDIVTTLIGEKKFTNKRKGILLCMRNDSEQFYSKKKIKKFRKRLEGIAPNAITDTTIKKAPEFIEKNIENILEEVFEKFSKVKLIITDRYHGTIFSLISNTPVIVLGSTDHKLVSGVNWFNGVYEKMCFFAKDLEEAYCLAETIYKDDNRHDVYQFFEKNYYEKLYDLVENAELKEGK